MAKNPTLLHWLIAGISFVPAAAAAGEIHGTLTVPGAAAKFSVASAGKSRGSKFQLNPVTDAVVYVVEIPDKFEKRLAKNAAVARMGQAFGVFIPRTLFVAAGTTVEFENQDRVYHNAFSVSPVRRFDLHKYAPRESRRVTFDRPGAVQVFCDIDPNETGFIFVTPNHAFARPEANGDFTLPKLPKGKYKVRVWHPRFGSISKDVDVPGHGDVSVALRL